MVLKQQQDMFELEENLNKFYNFSLFFESEITLRKRHSHSDFVGKMLQTVEIIMKVAQWIFENNWR